MRSLFISVAATLVVFAPSSELQSQQKRRELFPEATVEKQITVDYPVRDLQVAKQSGDFLAMVDKPDGLYGVYYDSSGEKKWEKKFPDQASPECHISDNGQVILTSWPTNDEGDQTIVYDRTGSVIWESRDAGYMVSPSGGRIVDGGGNGFITVTLMNGKKVRIMNSAGKERYLYQVVGFRGDDSLIVIRKLVVDDGFINPELVLFSFQEGNILWVRSLPSDYNYSRLGQSPVLIEDSKIFVSGFELHRKPAVAKPHTLFCFSIQGGVLLWQKEFKSIDFISPMTVSGNVIVATGRYRGGPNEFEVIDDTGEIVYKGTFGNHLFSPSLSILSRNQLIVSGFERNKPVTFSFMLGVHAVKLEEGETSEESYALISPKTRAKLLHLKHSNELEIRLLEEN